jgi:hypothetical protein
VEQLTSNERSGLFTFLVIEGTAVCLFAPVFAVVSQLGDGHAMQTVSEAYFKYAAKGGCWFGSLAIPVSIAWMFVRSAAADRARPRLAEIGRVLLFEFVVIAFFAVFYVEFGPAFMEPAPQWSDVPKFGWVLLFWCGISLALGVVARVALAVMRTTGLIAFRDRNSAGRSSDLSDADGSTLG